MEVIVTMNNNYLKHHGVKGMKWGVRKETLVTGARIAKSASEGFKSASNIAGTVNNNKTPSKKVRNDLSQMSDDELRRRINRLNMEQQYSNLNPSRTSRGASFAKSTLEVAGSVAAIAGSALSIALAIKQLKG